MSEEEIEKLSIDGEAFDAADLAPEVDDGRTGTEAEAKLLHALQEDLQRGEHAKAVLAEAEMRRVIELSKHLEHRPIDGLGQTVARIPLEMFLFWTAVEGPDFWHDPKNLDYFEKKAEGGRGNPGIRIKSVMDATVVVDGFRDRNLPAGRSARPAFVGYEGKPSGTCSSVPDAPRRPGLGKRGRWRA